MYDDEDMKIYVPQLPAEAVQSAEVPGDTEAVRIWRPEG